MKGSQRRLALGFALAASVAGLLAAFVALEGLWPGGRLANERLHATVEALGGLIAVVMATFLLQRKREAYAGTLFLLALGFIGMGLLDLFHATTRPDKGFVLLHSVASLVGGFWFALAWFPELAAGGERPFKRWAPVGAVVGAVVFGAWTLAARDTLPAMTRDGTFTGTAVVINVLAGALFMLGAARLLLDFRRTNEIEIYLLACMAGLFGLANLGFPFSTLWGHSWWMWHVLRLTAYVLALGFTVHQYHGTVSDLSTALVEHHEAEGRLRDAEARYRTLFEQSPDGIVIVDTQTGLPIEFNETAPRQLGYTREEFARRRINDYEAVEKPEESKARIQKILREGRDDFETRHRSKTGELRNVLVTVQVLDLSGPPVLHCIFRDLTESKKAEEALRASEARYRSYVDATGQIAWVTSTRGEIVEDVPSLRKFSGQTYEEAKGSGWAKTIHPDDLERTLHVWNEAVATRSNYEIEYRMRRHDGVYRHLLARGFPVFGEDGAIREWVGTCIDITERKLAEEEIHNLNAGLERRVIERTAQLEAANKELVAFSYSVSHDLRAPLRAIDGYGRILLEDYEDRLDPEGRRVLGVISSETRRMGQLIDDLLAFSRMGRQQLESSSINMTALTQAVLEEQAAQAPKRVFQLELMPLPPAHGDRAMIRVVLSNLLSNAIKFTTPRTPAVIEIGSRQADGQAVYYVKDNGVGFDMNYADKLFGVFQRLHSTEEFEGNGVGLALVQRVIHRHGGRVWAEGKVNEGATFYFSLPTMKGQP